MMDDYSASMMARGGLHGARKAEQAVEAEEARRCGMEETDEAVRRADELGKARPAA